MSSKQAWAGFWILSLIWGSSFLFIRIGVEEVPPMQLVFARTAIAAIGLNLVIWLQGKRLPTNRQGVIDLLVLGVVNTVFPFALITWGEVYIESSLAAILQATAALFTLIVAHFYFADERITLRKIVGLLVGFVGVVVLVGRSGAQNVEADPTMHLLGQLAIVAASLCYAVGGVYSRKAMQGRLDPLVAAAGSMTVAALLSGALAYGVLPWALDAQTVSFASLAPAALWAILALGFINTFGAYMIWYPLVVALGAARSSMITYVIPVVGLALGALVLNEPIVGRLLLGAALILGSIAIVNVKFNRGSASKPVAVAE